MNPLIEKIQEHYKSAEKRASKAATKKCPNPPSATNTLFDVSLD
jgi:hypothetical protein